MATDNYQFTKEGILLGIFKMTLQNNAMLKTALGAIARIYEEMPMNPNIATKEAEFTKMRLEFERQLAKMNIAQEQLSTIEAYNFAVEHDSNLDNDLLEFVFDA